MALRGVTNQSYEEVLADLKYRDHQDSTRSFAPLVKTPDAIVIDTTTNTPEETLQKLLSPSGEVRSSRIRRSTMKITVASSSGFCFGVNKAVQTAREILGETIRAGRSICLEITQQ